MKNLLFKFGVFSVLFALSASPLHAVPVNCDAPGQDLQARIDATALGDQLDVMGVCDDGPYVITQDIVLVGPATLLATARTVLTVNTARAELRNITFVADNAKIGILVEHNGSVIANKIVVSGAAQAGIAVGYSSTLSINLSTIKENRTGVNVVNGSNLRMTHTTIEHNTLDGVNVSRTSDGSIFSSKIQHNSGNGVVVLWDGTLQLSTTEITNNGRNGLVISLQSFVNFFNPPSTIESNGVSDVRCEGRSAFFARSRQISVTKGLSKTADCFDGLGNFVPGIGAPVF